MYILIKGHSFFLIYIKTAYFIISLPLAAQGLKDGRHLEYMNYYLPPRKKKLLNSYYVCFK